MPDPPAPPDAAARPREGQAAGDSFVGLLADRPGWYAPDRRPWRRHALRLLAAALALLLAYGAAAAAVNPRGEFPWQPVQPISSEDAAYKRWLLERRPEPPQALVLGSSRSQKVAPADVEAASGLAAFNFAIADAYPGDALAVYQGVRGEAPPREVILGLDLNRLDPAEEDAGRTRHAFGPLHRDPAPQDWLRAFLRTYTQLYARQAAGAVLEDAGVVGEGLVAFDPDGLAHYVPWETAIAEGTFDQQETLRRFIGDRSGYRPFTGLDPQHVQDVRDLVALARADDATVRVWLTPVHPALEATYGNESYPQHRAAARGLLLSLCQPGVHAYDYGELEAFGGRPEWFFDGSHMMQENARLAVHAMHEGRGDLCAPA